MGWFGNRRRFQLTNLCCGRSRKVASRAVRSMRPSKPTMREVLATVRRPHGDGTRTGSVCTMAEV